MHWLSSRSLKNFLLLIFICCLTFSSASCKKSSSDDGDSGGGDDGGGGSSDSQFSISSVTGQSNGSGEARIGFDISEGVTKFFVQADIPRGFAQFESIQNTEGQEFAAPGGAFTTLGQSFSDEVNFINIPSRDFDPQVSGPDSFTAILNTASNTAGSRLGNVPLTLTVTTSTDSNLGGGNLVMHVFYVGSIGQAAQVKEAVGKALSQAEDIYGSVGISISPSEHDLSGPAVVPDPFSGGDIYFQGSSSVGGPAVYVFMAGDVDASFGAEVYGISGGIPGSPNASRYSAVAVSIANAAGPDGIFSDQEIRTLSETIAHESGHYLGLFHPVEISGIAVTGEDPLPDTDTCLTINTCLSDASLIGNLMFPVPVENDDGSFVRQNQLTDQQGGVMNRHVAVN